MEINETATIKIKRHIWITYKSRYNAHRRILLKDRLQLLTLTLISIFILGISVIILNPTILGTQRTQYSNIYLIILSIILLAMSISIGHSNNKLDAFKFHNCARKLHRLYDYIEMEIEKDSSYQISNDEDKYNDILDKYDLNHDKIDWDCVVFQDYKNNKKNLLQLVLFKIYYFAVTQLLYWALIIIPVISYIGILNFIEIK